MSLNGKIADENGGVDWLDKIEHPENYDYGYQDFYHSIDTTIQGAATFRQITGWDIEFPYKDKKNYVFSRANDMESTAFAEVISENHIEFTKSLKNKEGKDIWLIGGGQINTLLLNEGLIDEMRIHVMPIVLTDGVDLFEGKPKQSMLQLIESKMNDNGVLELIYKLPKTSN